MIDTSDCVYQDRAVESESGADRLTCQAPGLCVLWVGDGRGSDRTRRLLRMDGHRVTLATDDPSARRNAALNDFDAVVLELGTGAEMAARCELARCLQKEMIAKRPLLIALSERPTAASWQCAQEAGVDVYWPQWIGAEELRHVLRRFQSILGDDAL